MDYSRHSSHSNVVPSNDMILIAGAAFLFAVLASIAESIFARDWPRDTFRYVVIFGIALVWSLSI